MFLHVGPHLNPFGISGLTEESNEFVTDSCFWEIFEHARRLLIAIHTLAETLQPSLMADHNPEELERLGTAWVRTQEMQQIWQQLIGFRDENCNDENDSKENKESIARTHERAPCEAMFLGRNRAAEMKSNTEARRSAICSGVNGLKPTIFCIIGALLK